MNQDIVGFHKGAAHNQIGQTRHGPDQYFCIIATGEIKKEDLGKP